MSAANQGYPSTTFSMTKLATLAGLLLIMGISGCSSLNPENWRALPQPLSFFRSTGGELAIRSQTVDGPTMKSGFSDGYFTVADKNTLTVVMFEGPVEAPTQAVTIRMFWNPRAGKTPVDETATNATIHYIIFTGENREDVGIYSGAGFVYPNSGLDGDKLVAGVWQSSLRLTDQSKGFHDRLGQATLEGRFTVQRNDGAIEPTLHGLYVQIRERLGRSRLVKSDQLPSLSRAD